MEDLDLEEALKRSYNRPNSTKRKETQSWPQKEEKSRRLGARVEAKRLNISYASALKNIR